MPVKDLHGRPRRSPGELALERLFRAKISAMRRRRRPGPEDDTLPITPPRPGPTPLKRHPKNRASAPTKLTIHQVLDFRSVVTPTGFEPVAPRLGI